MHTTKTLLNQILFKIICKNAQTSININVKKTNYLGFISDDNVIFHACLNVINIEFQCWTFKCSHKSCACPGVLSSISEWLTDNNLTILKIKINLLVSKFEQYISIIHTSIKEKYKKTIGSYVIIFMEIFNYIFNYSSTLGMYTFLHMTHVLNTEYINIMNLFNAIFQTST